MALSDQDILDFVGENLGAGRDAIRKGVARDVSETTVWRLLKRLVEEGRLEVSGKGRATGYRIAGGAVVRAHVSTRHCQVGWKDGAALKVYADRASNASLRTMLNEHYFRNPMTAVVSPRPDTDLSD